VQGHKITGHHYQYLNFSQIEVVDQEDKEASVSKKETKCPDFWDGDYDANYGLFGQRAITPGEPITIVPTELEALKLASIGKNAVCLSKPEALDSVTMTILADNLKSISREIYVWNESSFDKRVEAMETFVLSLARNGSFKLVAYIDPPDIMATKAKDIDTTKLKARDWKPKGIQFTDEILDSGALQQATIGVPTGYKCLDDATGGLRGGEVTMFTAGTGVGKSTIVREIAFHLGVAQSQKVGMIFLEELPKKTLNCLAAIEFNVPAHELSKNPEVVPDAKWTKFNSNRAIRNNFIFYNHFGSLEADKLFNKIEYMVDFCGCKFICLDHISIAVSGMSSKEGERKDIDVLMTKLVQLAVSKEIHIIAITHLSSPDGTPHEEGGRVGLNQLRGSKSISQLSFNIFALERNQQDEHASRALVRALKCRETGITGCVGVVNYNLKTGRLLEDFSHDPKELEKLMRPQGRGYGRQQYGKSTGGNGTSNFAGGY
jgi:twinkle protein